MLTSLLCMALGSAWAGSAEDLRNEWSGEYDPPGNVTVAIAPLSIGDLQAPTLDVLVELRTGETRSFAVTGATDLSLWQGLGGGRGADRMAYDLGFQLRDYVVGNFDNGLFVGGHVGFVNPDLRRLRSDRTSFGPMAGVKVTMSIFTVQARGGASIGLGAQGFQVEPLVDFRTGLTF